MSSLRVVLYKIIRKIILALMSNRNVLLFEEENLFAFFSQSARSN